MYTVKRGPRALSDWGGRKAAMVASSVLPRQSRKLLLPLERFSSLNSRNSLLGNVAPVVFSHQSNRKSPDRGAERSEHYSRALRFILYLLTRSNDRSDVSLEHGDPGRDPLAKRWMRNRESGVGLWPLSSCIRVANRASIGFILSVRERSVIGVPHRRRH